MYSVNTGLKSSFSDLSTEELAILQVISSYGIVTKQVLKTVKPLSDLTASEIDTVLRSLTNRKIMIARPLHHGQSYFALSKETVLKLGISEHLGNPLSEQSKIRALARLIFFTRYRPGFDRLDKQQIAARLGQPCHGLPNGFYRNPSDPGFLGFLRVDTHVHCSPDRSSQILRSDIISLVSFKQIEVLFKSKQFEFSWITATQRRASSVMQRFRKYDHVGGAPIHVVVIPELIPLVTSIMI